MRARDVIELLAARHSNDVFVAECKDGPTWGGGAMRLDAFAMRRSWANPCTFGYEVKVARSDWLNDTKWHLYRDLVNEFSVVAPAGVIKPEEVPAGVGYLQVASTGTMLVRKIKATRQETDPAAQNMLLQYVLQSRCTIDAPREPRTVDEWRAWLARKEEARDIGHQVAAALRDRYMRDVALVRRQIKEAEDGAEEARQMMAAARALGVDFDRHRGRYVPADQAAAENAAMVLLAVVRNQIPGHIRERMRADIATLTRLLEDPETPR